MNKFLPALTLCLATLPAHALVISQTSTILDESIIDIGSLSDPLASAQTVEATYGDFEFTFDQFDPSLGTLTDIRISYSFSYTVTATSNSQANNDDKFLSINNSFGYNFYTDGGNFDGNGNGGGTGTGDPDTELTVTVVMTDTDDSDFYEPILSDAQGTGQFTISAIQGAVAYNAQIYGYFSDYEIKRDAGAYFQVDFEYTPVPEPSTYAMLLGVATLGWVYLRRRKC